MAASRIAGITVEIGGDTTKLSKALSGINKEIKETQTALKDVNKLLKIDPGNTELLRQKQNDLKNAIQETKDKLKSLQDTAKNSDLGAAEHDALQREIIDTEQQLKSLETEYRNFGSVAAQQIAVVGEKMQAIGGRISSVGKSISDFGGKLTAGVTLPLAAIGTAGAVSFAEVDKTMQLTNKTMGSTTEEADALNSAMKDAAANSVYGMNDAATATLNFARAGLDASQAADALAPAMNLAAGEGGNLDTVSAGLVATINGFHGAFSEAGNYADVFAAACNNSALDVDSLSNAMSVAAPIFASAGYSVNDAALYMGVMANNGIEADKAANSLKTGIARLVSPAKEGAEKMKELGISVTNADGSMKDSVTIQRELHDAFGKLSESEQIAAASAIFGKNQMAPWLALINTAPEDVDSLNQSLANCSGTTKEMADTMMGGFGGSLEKLKSSIDVLMYSIGQALAPTIQKVVDVVQSLADRFNALTPAQQQTITTIGLVVAAIGPAIAIIGKLVSGVGGIVSAIGKALTVVPKVVGVLKTLWGVLSANPIGAVITIVSALVAGFIYLWNNCEGFREFWINLWDKIKSVCSAAVEAVKTGLSNAWNAIKNTVSTVWNGIKNTISTVWNGIKTTVTNAVNAVKTGLSNAWNAIKNTVSTVWNGIKTTVSNVWNGTKTTVTTAVNAVKSGLSTAWNNIKGTASTAWNNVKSTISSAWENIKGKVSSAAENVKSKMSAAWENVKSKTSGAWSSAKSTVASAASNIASTIQSKFNAAKSTVSSIFDSIKSAISSKLDTAKNVVHNAIEKIKSFFHFEWSLPKIKLPHFSITGKFSLNPPSIPHFSVSWYRKAMDNAVMLNDATIFGASGGKLLGGGEAGREMIIGKDRMMSMIRSATGGDTMARYLAQYLPYLKEIAAKDTDVILDGRSITKTVERNITRSQKIRGLQGGLA